MARTTEGSSYTPAPQGNHAARVISYVYLGTQTSTYGTRKQCWLEFELTKTKADDGLPHRVGRFFTFSTGPKAALREAAEGILGRALSPVEAKAFTVSALLGEPCMVQVTHTESESGPRAKVAAIAPVPEGLEVPNAKVPQLDYDFEEDGREIGKEVPEFIADIIKGSAEWTVQAA